MNPQEIEEFGRLIRSRRQSLSLSQEAVAAEAFGNPDRKSYISAIENGKQPRITSETALKLAKALELPLDVLPGSLRSVHYSSSPAEPRVTNVDHDQLARAFNSHILENLSDSVAEAYRNKLRHALQSVRHWTGAPFSIQSLAFSFVLSFVYVSLLGLAGYGAGTASVGEVAPYQRPDWAPSIPQSMLALLAAVLLVGSALLCFLIARPPKVGGRSFVEIAVRLVMAAFVAGLGVFAARILGSEPIAASAIVAAAAFAALSGWPPVTAALAGFTGAFVSGVAGGFVNERDVFEYWANYLLVGGSVGLTAGYLASWFAKRIPEKGPAQVAGTGVGLAIGVVFSGTALVTARSLFDVETRVVGLMALMWVILPIANAIMDFVSLGISHLLGQTALKKDARFGTVLFAGALDLAAALTLMLATAFAIEGALWSGQVVFGVDFDARNYIFTALADPWGTGIWLSLMMLSTLTWTYLHFALIVSPLLAAKFVSFTIERPLIAKIVHDTNVGRLALGASAFAVWRHVAVIVIWIALSVLPLIAVTTWFGDLLHLMRG